MQDPEGLPADSLRRVLDQVFEDPAFSWVERPHPLAFLQRWWMAVTDWLMQVRENQPGMFDLIIWVLVALLLALIAHAGWVVWRTVKGAAPPPEADTTQVAAPRREPRGLWIAAERAASAGRFRDALGLAFDALVLEFDDRGVVRYHPAKTPAEYAREARLTLSDALRLRNLVTALYRVDFAGEPCDSLTYIQWRDEARRRWHASAD